MADEPHVHGIQAYRKGSRDPECVKANWQAQKRWRDQQKGRKPPKRVHGTLNGYQIYGCTCAKCKAAQQQSRDRQRQTKKRMRELVARGLPRTYQGPL